jgi:hypothetical protein
MAQFRVRGYDSNPYNYRTEGAIAKILPQKTLPVLATSRAEPIAQNASPSFSPRKL